VSFTWREAIDIWRGLQAENRVTAKMSEAYGSGTARGRGAREKLDKCLKRVEVLIARYNEVEAAEQGRQDGPGEARAEHPEGAARRGSLDADLRAHSAASCARLATRW